MEMSNRKSYSIADTQETGLILNSREVFLRSGTSQEEPTINHHVSEIFLMNLRILEQDSKAPIVVHQQTVGGDWHSGMAIYDAIKSSPCNFVFICHGICASMGAIIAQAPLNKGIRISMPNCEWLIHEGSCAVDGTYKQMFSLYEFEKKMMDKSYDILSMSGHKTGEYFQGSKEGAAKRFIKRQLNTKEDWWLSAEDAKYYGFIDGIWGDKEFESLEKMIKYVS